MNKSITQDMAYRPVSYTHLDVYKRQARRRAAFNGHTDTLHRFFRRNTLPDEDTAAAVS